jgi:hypothetical protein
MAVCEEEGVVPLQAERDGEMCRGGLAMTASGICLTGLMGACSGAPVFLFGGLVGVRNSTLRLVQL